MSDIKAIKLKKQEEGKYAEMKKETAVIIIYRQIITLIVEIKKVQEILEDFQRDGKFSIITLSVIQINVQIQCNSKISDVSCYLNMERPQMEHRTAVSQKTTSEDWHCSNERLNVKP